MLILWYALVAALIVLADVVLPALGWAVFRGITKGESGWVHAGMLPGVLSLLGWQIPTTTLSGLVLKSALCGLALIPFAAAVLGALLSEKWADSGSKKATP